MTSFSNSFMMPQERFVREGPCLTTPADAAAPAALGWHGAKAARIHHNGFGGFLELRPAWAAWGQGEVRCRNFRYPTLT